MESRYFTRVGLLVVAQPAYLWLLERPSGGTFRMEKVAGPEAVEFCRKGGLSGGWAFSPAAFGSEESNTWRDKWRKTWPAGPERTSFTLVGPVQLAHLLRYDETADSAPVLCRRAEGSATADLVFMLYPRCDRIRFDESMTTSLLELRPGEQISGDLYPAVAGSMTRARHQEQVRRELH
jgi:type III secretion system FlhB-like substrate exporter